MSLLNIAEFVACTESEGPGKRSAVWVQGCLQRCPGCCNPHMWELKPRHILGWREIMESVVEARCKMGIEGVTLLGGEPFLQARGLSKLAEECKDAGLSVLVFTGYTLERLLQENFPYTEELLGRTDVLIDGPYMRESPERRRHWVGSSNQRFHYLSGFYTPAIEAAPHYCESAEIRIRLEGQVLVNGMPGIVRIG